MPLIVKMSKMECEKVILLVLDKNQSLFFILIRFLHFFSNGYRNLKNPIEYKMNENRPLFLNLNQHGLQIANDIWLIIKEYDFGWRLATIRLQFIILGITKLSKRFKKFYLNVYLVSLYMKVWIILHNAISSQQKCTKRDSEKRQRFYALDPLATRLEMK